MPHEATIRLVAFFGVLALVAFWEIRAPRRELSQKKTQRWTCNLGMVVLGAVLLRLVLLMTAVALALTAARNGWGIFNQIDVPYPVALIVSVVALDFAIYLQHVMFHAVPVLWRLHRVHHVDMDYDLTTGVRFHPVEILLSMLIKFAAVLVLGPPAAAVVVFEVLLNATAMFNHGNVRIPEGLDRVLRRFVVTPDMHRVHHSIEDAETNSNFGFNLPWWDRLCGTYRAQPQAGHLEMTIGTRGLRNPHKTAGLLPMLWYPLAAAPDAYTINQRRWDLPDDGPDDSVE